MARATRLSGRASMGSGNESPSEQFQLVEQGLPSFCTLSTPHSITLADFNSDGRTDILLTCEMNRDDRPAINRNLDRQSHEQFLQHSW